MDEQQEPRKHPGKPEILLGDTVLCNFCESTTNTYLKNLVDETKPSVPICPRCLALSEPIDPPQSFSVN